MWALGVTGTYLGDYFGILMDEPVTGFPFNVTGAPMYWGSTCSFLGTALYMGKPVGVLLSVQVFFMYLVALQFEEYVLKLYLRIARANEDVVRSRRISTLSGIGNALVRVRIRRRKRRSVLKNQLEIRISSVLFTGVELQRTLSDSP